MLFEKLEDFNNPVSKHNKLFNNLAIFFIESIENYLNNNLDCNTRFSFSINIPEPDI